MNNVTAAFTILFLGTVLSIGSCQKGPKGDKGDKGDPGTSCSVIQLSNGAEVRCTDGTVARIVGEPCTARRTATGVEISCGSDSYLVEDGQPGVQGPAGAQGIPGIPGSDGTTVTFVQFCSQYTNSYGSFPEYGLCVNGSIFGVYWDSHGKKEAFGSKLPEGYYQTTNTELPCNFHVGPNCTIY